MQGEGGKLALLSFKRRLSWILLLSATTWWESVGKVESDFLKVRWGRSGGIRCKLDGCGKFWLYIQKKFWMVLRVVKHLTGCPEGWWILFCRRYSKLVWAMHWATLSNGLCFERWFGLETSRSPFQHVWIYDSCPTSIYGLWNCKENQRTLKKITHSYVNLFILCINSSF